MNIKRKKSIAFNSIFPTAIFLVFALLFAMYSKISNPHFILEHADHLTVYSIQPDYTDQEWRHTVQRDKFRDSIVLGKVIVTDSITKKQLTNALHGRDESDQQFKVIIYLTHRA